MRGLSAEYERRARFWMRAFPARFNAAHADEMLGTLADTAAPNATRLNWRTRFDLVRAGWWERLRDRPNPRLWLRYQLTGRLPERWHAWMFDDLDAPWKKLLLGASIMVAWCVALGVVRPSNRSFSALFLPAAFVAGQIVAQGARRWRRKVLTRNGYDPETRRRPAGWLPDPNGVHEWRYWNGREWSHYAADQGVTVEDPTPV